MRGLRRIRLAVLGCCLYVGWVTSAAASCAEFRQGEVDVGTLAVSTFHVTQIPGTFLNVPMYRPSAYRFPLSGRPIGQTKGTEQEMDFHLSISEETPSKAGPFSSLREDPDQLRLRIKGVQSYPLSSRLGLLAGRPGPLRAPLMSADGTTYHPSDGYVFTGEDLPDGWRGVAYPEPRWEKHTRYLYWARFDSSDEIEGLLACREPYDRGVRCEAYFKYEPFFAEGVFHVSQLDHLDKIEARMRNFTECLTEN